MDSKKTEISHYDKKIASLAQNQVHLKQNKNINDYVIRAIENCFDSKVSEQINRNPKTLILDYGCGTGQRTLKFGENTRKLIGVDLSINSIKMAKDISVSKGIAAEYCLMDCEQLAFKSDTFDLLIDYGTFSSLHLDPAIEEIIRVLKANGTLIAVETFGHNPIMNIKRKINVLFGARTKWAASHILKQNDWEKIRKRFANSEINYFILMTPLMVPLFKILPKSIFDHLLNKIEGIDFKLLKRPVFQKFAFKTVVIMSNPDKSK